MKHIKLIALLALALFSTALNAAVKNELTIKIDTKQMVPDYFITAATAKVNYCLRSDVNDRIVYIKDKTTALSPGGKVPFEIKIDIPQGMHLYNFHFNVSIINGDGSVKKVLQQMVTPGDKGVVTIGIKYDKQSATGYAISSFSGCRSIVPTEQTQQEWRTAAEKEMEACQPSNIPGPALVEGSMVMPKDMENDDFSSIGTWRINGFYVDEWVNSQFVCLTLEYDWSRSIDISIDKRHLSERIDLSKYDSLRGVIDRGFYTMIANVDGSSHVLAYGSESDGDWNEQLCEKGSYLYISQTGPGMYNVAFSLKNTRGVRASAQYSGLFIPNLSGGLGIIYDGQDKRFAEGTYLGLKDDYDKPFGLLIKTKTGDQIGIALDGSSIDKTIDLSKLDPLDGQSGKQVFSVTYTPKGGDVTSLAFGSTYNTTLCEPGSILRVSKHWQNGKVRISVDLRLVSKGHRLVCSIYGEEFNY